ncbi:hypothetical protein BRAS3809_1290001 [Bradyrhizobium sp. STM 3809]|nr:hypothetical protein BRAS3809_1290001 [Bradyrhizobium sp. STM 3809]
MSAMYFPDELLLGTDIPSANESWDH